MSSRLLVASARGLTLSRFLLLPFFVWALAAADRTGDTAPRAATALVFAWIALSDFLDGRLARAGDGASPAWGRIDVLADVVFNVSALATLAWLGRLGPWVAAGVAVLGGRHLVRLGTSVAVPPDPLGRAAGVLYYALVGVAVIEIVLGGVLGWPVVARLGDLVFLYTLVVWIRGIPARFRASAG